MAGYEGMVTDKGDEVVMTHCDDLSVAVGDGDSVSVDRGDNKPPGNFNALARACAHSSISRISSVTTVGFLDGDATGMSGMAVVVLYVTL